MSHPPHSCSSGHSESIKQFVQQKNVIDVIDDIIAILTDLNITPPEKHFPKVVHLYQCGHAIMQEEDGTCTMEVNTVSFMGTLSEMEAILYDNYSKSGSFR